MAVKAEIWSRYAKLKEYIASFGSAATAFSGGVDSAFLLHAAKDALGEKAIAITADAAAFPEREMREAVEFCTERGIEQYTFNADALQAAAFMKNPRNRCYLCKKGLFTEILRIASDHGMNAVLEGSNIDDLGDYRPGLQAISELSIRSPLRECGFTKADIRALSREFCLPTWNKQSFACLASRFPYGDEITPEKLRMVSRAEQYLLDMGLTQLRVRVHGNVARIEVLPEDIEKLVQDDTRNRINDAFREYGFEYIALDLAGYRTGSMNIE